MRELKPRDGSSRFRQTLDAIRCPEGGRRDAVWGLLYSCRDYLQTMAERKTEPALRRLVGPSDLVTEAMLDAHDNILNFRGQTEGQFRRWLGAILRTRLNRARRRLRTSSLSLPDSTYTRVDAALIAPDTPPSERLRRSEDADRLHRVLATMPEHYRQVLLLHFVEQRTEKQIAEELGLTEAATHGSILRAIRKLRTDLALCR